MNAERFQELRQDDTWVGASNSEKSEWFKFLAEAWQQGASRMPEGDRYRVAMDAANKAEDAAAEFAKLT